MPPVASSRSRALTPLPARSNVKVCTFDCSTVPVLSVMLALNSNTCGAAAAAACRTTGRQARQTSCVQVCDCGRLWFGITAHRQLKQHTCTHMCCTLHAIQLLTTCSEHNIFRQQQRQLQARRSLMGCCDCLWAVCVLTLFGEASPSREGSSPLGEKGVAPIPRLGPKLQANREAGRGRLCHTLLCSHSLGGLATHAPLLLLLLGCCRCLRTGSVAAVAVTVCLLLVQL